jgi:general secretion pathway protein G
VKKKEKNALHNGTFNPILKSLMIFTLILVVFLTATSSTESQATTSKARNSSAQKKEGNCKATRDTLKVEEELRVALRELRQAIDRYNIFCETGGVGALDRRIDDQCYPANLEILVTGIIPPNKTTPVRFLRKIPIDPTTGKREWGLRSMQDDPLATKWGGENVFDVYSKNTAKSLEGMSYQDW